MLPKSLAIQTATQAGKLLLHYFRRLKPGQIHNKSQHELVTIADFKAEAIILRAIRKYFPQHRILSEEKGKSGSKKSDYLWAVDPLDGTNNFCMGNPLFALSIALFNQDQPILGLINAPFLGEIYLAEKNQGAFLNNKKIHVSPNKSLRTGILTFCHGHSAKAYRKSIQMFNAFKQKAIDYRQLGSAAVEHAFVASGRTEAIMINDANTWDVAAGALLVREAGGRVTDFAGQKWNLRSRDILASNGRVHTEILKYLRDV